MTAPYDLTPMLSAAVRMRWSEPLARYWRRLETNYAAALEGWENEEEPGDEDVIGWRLTEWAFWSSKVAGALDIAISDGANTDRANARDLMNRFRPLVTAARAAGALYHLGQRT